MPRPLYPRRKNPWYPLDRRFRGHQNRSGPHGEQKNKVLTLAGHELRHFRRPASSQSLYRLRYPVSRVSSSHWYSVCNCYSLFHSFSCWSVLVLSSALFCPNSVLLSALFSSVLASALFSLLTSAESESYVTTDGQSASLSWNKGLIWGLRPDFYYCQTVAGLLIWGALSDERTGVSFTIAARPSQRSHSRVRVPFDSRPYFTVSDSRLLTSALFCLVCYIRQSDGLEDTLFKGSVSRVLYTGS
jgi:hypothetical protein